MRHSLNSLKGGLSRGSHRGYFGVIRGDTRNLDDIFHNEAGLAQDCSVSRKFKVGRKTRI